VFAANAIAMIKLWPLASRASAIQRWSYVAPSAMTAAWATLQSGTFALIVTQRKAGALPVAVAPLLAGFVTALGLGVLWVRPRNDAHVWVAAAL
jgi:hypothetical protein